MSDTPTQFVDVSLTDGQSAVWGGAMTAAMKLHVLGALEGSGLAAVEAVSSETIVQSVRQGEDPWQFVDLLRHQAPGLTLRACLNLMTEHGRKGRDILADDVVAGWIGELARRGIAEIVFIDPLTDLCRLEPAFGFATTHGVVPIGTLVYGGDVTEDAVFVGQVAALVKAGAKRIMLRDESGLLTPDAVATLIPALKEALKDVPLTLHTRCTTGLGPKVAGDAVKLGVDAVDTALSALANGGSTPSSVNLISSMAAVGVALGGVNMAALTAANDVARDIADCESFDAATPWGFDFAPYIHKLPGTVAAWAMTRMTTEGLRGDALHAFAHECEQVCADIGGVPMVSPFARGVAEQALSNLLAGQRYAELRPIIRRTLQGVYGKYGPVQDDLLGWLGAVAPQQPVTLAEMRKAEPSANDTQHLLRAISGCPIADQPQPQKLSALIYEMKSPLEHLNAAAVVRAARYGTIHITGPGIDIRETHEGAARC